MIHGKTARISVHPIKQIIAVMATCLTLALLLSVMYCQRGIRLIIVIKTRPFLVGLGESGYHVMSEV